MINEIAPEAKEIIETYLHLPIKDTLVQTPYYINVKRVRAELRSLVGKGSPEEIIEEVKIFAQLRGFRLKGFRAEDNPSSEKIKLFMQSQGIGIDCSGYISQIFDYVLRKKTRRGLYFHMKFRQPFFYSWILHMFRPIEHSSAHLLTCELNADPIDYHDTQPGDLIRLKGIKHGDHIALIIETETNSKTHKLESITYTHSSNHFDKENGARIGKIIITDLKKPLEKQNWTEQSNKGYCPTLKQYLNKIEDNGIVRPKFFEKLK
jgi:hypothetical protein